MGEAGSQGGACTRLKNIFSSHRWWAFPMSMGLLILLGWKKLFKDDDESYQNSLIAGSIVGGGLYVRENGIPFISTATQNEIAEYIPDDVEDFFGSGGNNTPSTPQQQPTPTVTDDEADD